MAALRKPFQGVSNIIRFNWHFYLIAIVALAALSLVANLGIPLLEMLSSIAIIGIILTTTFSLLISYYVYDCSNLYTLDWIRVEDENQPMKLVNINAGFDESSELLAQKFIRSNLVILDFYDSTKHTEISIKRARKAYPAPSTTQSITTERLPLEDDTIDLIFAILSAHEIREEEERNLFFGELSRIIKQDGQIVIVEHLRDLANFLAYNIGFFHFHSRKDWLRTFATSNATIIDEYKITPFITVFILKKNGITS